MNVYQCTRCGAKAGASQGVRYGSPCVRPGCPGGLLPVKVPR